VKVELIINLKTADLIGGLADSNSGSPWSLSH